MVSDKWANLLRSRTYLIIDQTPLLKESVHPHNRADISSQISPAGSDRQIFYRVETVCIDHKVSIIFVYSWGLASISVIEELREGFSFDAVDLVHVEPGAITREDDRVCL